MVEDPDFLTQLRSLDEARAAQPVPSGMHERVGARLRAASGRRSVAPRVRRAAMLAFAAGSAAVLGLIGLDRVTDLTPVTRSADRWVIAEDLVLVTQGCELDRRASGFVVVPSDCDLAGDGVTLRSSGALTLSIDDQTLRVIDGDVLVSVEPRPGDPLRILVSHGVIEVIGTRFFIQQRSERGHVDLLEGIIAFDAGDMHTRLEPGQHLAWPSEPEPETLIETELETESAAETHAPPEISSARRPNREAAAASISARLTKLRSRGAHVEAIDLLREVLAERGWPARTRELWSFELGSLLAGKTPDVAAACAHWREHQRQFPDGRHAAAVRRSQRSLACE